MGLGTVFNILRLNCALLAYLLTDPVSPRYGLQIVLRVEIRVKDDDAVGRLKVNAKTSRLSGEQKAKVDRIRAVETRDRLFSLVCTNTTIKPLEWVPGEIFKTLKKTMHPLNGDLPF